MSFVATTGGIGGDDVRDLILAAVEHRFGQVNQLPEPIEWLTDNGSCYVARDTRGFTRDIGLEPRTTPLQSPQSNGMAEALVRTFKRDYARCERGAGCPYRVEQPSFLVRPLQPYPSPQDARLPFPDRVYQCLRSNLTLSGISGATTTE